jgi:hypothetical protein
MTQMSENIAARLGYAADPAIELLLPKDMLARIKIQKIDMAINELQSEMDVLKVQREMLAKEYGMG